MRFPKRGDVVSVAFIEGSESLGEEAEVTKIHDNDSLVVKWRSGPHSGTLATLKRDVGGDYARPDWLGFSLRGESVGVRVTHPWWNRPRGSKRGGAMTRLWRGFSGNVE